MVTRGTHAAAMLFAAGATLKWNTARVSSVEGRRFQAAPTGGGRRTVAGETVRGGATTSCPITLLNAMNQSVCPMKGRRQTRAGLSGCVQCVGGRCWEGAGGNH